MPLLNSSEQGDHVIRRQKYGDYSGPGAELGELLEMHVGVSLLGGLAQVGLGLQTEEFEHVFEVLVVPGEDVREVCGLEGFFQLFLELLVLYAFLSFSFNCHLSLPLNLNDHLIFLNPGFLLF